MFGVLLASYAINAMDRQLFPLVAPEVRREYGFSLAGIGLLSTVFTLGMAVAGAPTGFLLARFSRKAVLQTGIALFSAGTALTVVSRGFADMLMYRAVTGIGEAMQLTVLLAIAASLSIFPKPVGNFGCPSTRLRARRATSRRGNNRTRTVSGQALSRFGSCLFVIVFRGTEA